jgi:GNAT superfamily N-acetyltransferase
MDIPPIRRATMTDIAEILRLRTVMFRDMNPDVENGEWLDSSSGVLERHLSNATVIGAVADRPNGPGLCASGLLQIHEGLGSPRFPRGVFGYVGSVAVDPEWRKMGLGGGVIQFLIQEARTLRLERIELHATRDGERIYRKLGFRDRNGGIELRLEI